MENLFDLLFIFLLCQRGNNHFDVHFWRIRPVVFLSKDGKDAVYGKKWTERVCLPPELEFFLCKNYD